MLQKRIYKNSIPYGLGVAGEALTKGAVVQMTFVEGVETVALPASVAAGVAVGFVDLAINSDEGTYKTNDTIASGARCVVHLFDSGKGETWATTEFVATSLVVGGKATFDTNGKIVAIATTEPALFEVVEIETAASAYADPMITVRIL